MNREFFPSCYSDVMSRQYQKITSQQRRFCALEEAIFTVFGRSHNWWGAFSWKGLPCRPSWWNIFFLFHVHPAARFLVKGCPPSWWNLFSFFHVHPAAEVALWTLLTCHVYLAKYKANSKECSPPPSEMELSDHFVVWSPGNILHETSWYFSSKVVCLKYDIWCCSVIDFFVGS